MNLCDLINQLAIHISPGFEPVKFVNEVDPCVQTGSSERILKTVLRNLLNHAAANSISPTVRVNARTFHNVVLLRITYKSSRRPYDIEKKLQRIMTLLGSLGGCIYVNDSKIGETTLSMTFLEQQKSRVA